MAVWRWQRTSGSADVPAAHTQQGDREPREPRAPGDPARQSPIKLAQASPANPELPTDELPTLPALPNGSAATTPAEVFAVETRDAQWAPVIEAEITERMAKAPARLKADCRTSRCQLTLDGETEAVSKTIALFESEKGLIGFADNIYLTRPELHDDGTTTLHAIASFTR